MSSILTSQGMALATAMAVSGTVILLAFRLHKSFTPSELSVTPQPLPRSCIPPQSSPDGKKKDKKKKRVQFAADVVDPNGNSDEYRKKLNLRTPSINCHTRPNSSSLSTVKVEKMQPNRVALYKGILRDRDLHRAAYFY